MTDDLVKRYEVYPSHHGVDVEEWHAGKFVYYADHADRIEQLERELSISRMAQVVMDNSFEALTAEALYAAFLVEDDFGNYINKDPDTSSVTLDGCFSFDVIIAALKGESRD